MAVPGDTFEIRNAHYKVRGYTETPGCVASQNRLQQLQLAGEERNWGIVMRAYPNDSLVNSDDKGVRPFLYSG